VLCSWEGNQRSGIALAMHHRLCGVSAKGLRGLRQRDENPSPASVLRDCIWYLFSLYTNSQLVMFQWCDRGFAINDPYQNVCYINH